MRVRATTASSKQQTTTHAQPPPTMQSTVAPNHTWDHLTHHGNEEKAEHEVFNAIHIDVDTIVDGLGIASAEDFFEKLSQVGSIEILHGEWIGKDVRTTAAEAEAVQEDSPKGWDGAGCADCDARAQPEQHDRSVAFTFTPSHDGIPRTFIIPRKMTNSLRSTMAGDKPHPASQNDSFQICDLSESNLRMRDGAIHKHNNIVSDSISDNKCGINGVHGVKRLGGHDVDDDSNSSSSATTAPSSTTMDDSIGGASIIHDSIYDIADNHENGDRDTPSPASQDHPQVARKRVRFCSCSHAATAASASLASSAGGPPDGIPSNAHGAQTADCTCAPSVTKITIISRKSYSWEEKQQVWYNLKDLLMFKSDADRVWNDIRMGRIPMERGLEHRVKLSPIEPSPIGAAIPFPAAAAAAEHQLGIVENDTEATQPYPGMDEATHGLGLQDQQPAVRKQRYILRNRKKQRATARRAVMDAQREYLTSLCESREACGTETIRVEEELVANMYRPHTYSSQTLAAIVGLLDQKVAKAVYLEEHHDCQDDQHNRMTDSGSTTAGIDVHPPVYHHRDTIEDGKETLDADANVGGCGILDGHPSCAYTHSPKRRVAMFQMMLDCREHGYVLPGMFMNEL